LRQRRGCSVAEGTPEDVARVKESYTGQYLRELLGRRAKAEVLALRVLVERLV